MVIFITNSDIYLLHFQHFYLGFAINLLMQFIKNAYLSVTFYRPDKVVGFQRLI